MQDNADFYARVPVFTDFAGIMDPARYRSLPDGWLIALTDVEHSTQAIEDGRYKAVKCDMCKDLSGGPACVRACPTGAAIRVHPEEFMAYAGK